MGLDKLEIKLRKLTNPSKAADLQRFFKTGKGEYGKGDVFLGIAVGKQRRLAQEFKEINLSEVQELLDSRIHEKRLIGLLILIERFKRAPEDSKKEIFDFYIKNSHRVNNWDLVDLSAPNIVGNYLLDKPRDILYELAVSDNLWQRRISIISCFSFIKNKEFPDALEISRKLLNDKHDLIHKAVGWMLREIGKRDEKILMNFLEKNYSRMPRTALRYSIERFEEDKRKRCLIGKF